MKITHSFPRKGDLYPPSPVTSSYRLDACQRRVSTATDKSSIVKTENLICQKTLAVYRAANIRRHHEWKHASFSAAFCSVAAPLLHSLTLPLWLFISYLHVFVWRVSHCEHQPEDALLQFDSARQFNVTGIYDMGSSQVAVKHCLPTCPFLNIFHNKGPQYFIILKLQQNQEVFCFHQQ